MAGCIFYKGTEVSKGLTVHLTVMSSYLSINSHSILIDVRLFGYQPENEKNNKPPPNNNESDKSQMTK